MLTVPHADCVRTTPAGGAYLTDGDSLFWVMANREGCVLIEDALTLEKAWVDVRDLIRDGWRYVRR